MTKGKKRKEKTENKQVKDKNNYRKAKRMKEHKLK